MIKVHVHLETEYEYMDDDVFVEINLPAVPNKGDTLFLTKDLRRSLYCESR